MTLFWENVYPLGASSNMTILENSSYALKVIQIVQNLQAPKMGEFPYAKLRWVAFEAPVPGDK